MALSASLRRCASSFVHSWRQVKVRLSLGANPHLWLHSGPHKRNEKSTS